MQRFNLLPARLGLMACLPLAAVASPLFAQGLVYVDANDGFVGTPTLFPPSALNLEFAEEDNLWGYRENFGAEGVGGRYIYESGGTGSGVEDSPEIFQTVSGLTPSSDYDLYAVYWSSTGQNWAIRTGTTSGALTLYDRTGADGATAGVAANSVIWAAPPTADGVPIYAEGDRVMLLAYAGTVTVGASGETNVYFDDLPNNDFSDRSWLDGVAYAPSGVALSLTAMIDRNTGELTLSNNTGAAFDFAGVSITSASGVLDASSWLSIADNYDTGTVDTNPWEVTAPVDTPAFTGELAETQSEGASGAATLAIGQSLNLGGVWNDSRFEDVSISITLPNEGGTVTVTPSYTGLEHLLGDFDNSGAVDLADYAVFSANLHSDVSALTQAEAYLLGDMNGDLAINHADFVAFRDAFPGSLAAALAGVPEPASALLMSFAVGAAALRRSRNRRTVLDANQPQPHSLRPNTMNRSVLPAALAAAAVLFAAPAAFAINVNLNASDGFGTSSFNSAGGWSNGQAPSAGNDYFVTGAIFLRTPADGASYAFGGDSLTIGGSNAYPNGILYKGTGATGVVTVDDLILDAAFISHGNGVGDLFQLDGGITVVNDSTIYAKQGSINIYSSIGGSAGLTIPATDVPGDTASRVVRFFGANTFTGSIDVQAGGSFGLGATGSMTFDIGANGVNNTVAGDGFATFDGAFNLDLTGASTTLGDSWQLAGVATQSFGDNFSVAGFDNLGGTWFDGTYTFDESTGTLAVAPAPERLTLRVLSNGQVEIVNGNVSGGVDFNYYEVRSSTDALLTSWAGIDGPVAPGAESWERAGGSTTALISETNLLGSEPLALNESVSIGQAFGGVEADADLVEFYYGVPGSDDLIGGYVEFVTVEGLAGDYNSDGVVDAADYTVWRDGDSPDSSQTGYDVWAANYGATASAASATGVPEPMTAALVLASLAAALRRRA